MNRPPMYSRPDKPLTIPVQRREDPNFTPEELAEPITVDKFTECHVTPSDVAARMVEYLDPQPDDLILEPQAGTGQLVRALPPKSKVAMVERHIGLCQQLYELGPVVNQCFLEFATGTVSRYPRIIMNPPFKKVRAHVNAALSLLNTPGTLVALVPVTFEHPDAEELEHLPDTTFSTARVRTKIVRIQK